MYHHTCCNLHDNVYNSWYLIADTSILLDETLIPEKYARKKVSNAFRYKNRVYTRTVGNFQNWQTNNYRWYSADNWTINAYNINHPIKNIVQIIVKS